MLCVKIFECLLLKLLNEAKISIGIPNKICNVSTRYYAFEQ
jgi:hypothetical protein